MTAEFAIGKRWAVRRVVSYGPGLLGGERVVDKAVQIPIGNPWGHHSVGLSRLGRRRRGHREPVPGEIKRGGHLSPSVETHKQAAVPAARYTRHRISTGAGAGCRMKHRAGYIVILSMQ